MKEDNEFGFRCTKVENIQEERSRSHQTDEERGGRKIAEKATESREREFQEVCMSGELSNVSNTIKKWE